MSNRSDDFNRADGALNGSTPSDGGSTWTASNANISSNQVLPVSASSTRDTAWVETSSSVGSVQMTIATNGNSSGVVMRLSNATNHIVAYVSGNSLANYKRVSGSYTQIGSTYSGTIANGDVIKLDIDSSNAIRSYVNGTLRVGPNTDSTGSTNTKAGFEWLSNLTTVRIDSWSYTDNAGGASHDATGALSADAATLAGTATHLTLHSSSGALSAGSATVAGAAAHLTLHTATGALSADAATVAGSASLSSAGSFSATGALSSDAATLSGSAVHYTLHAATGAIAADAATVAGSAQHLTLHTATGDLIADAASVSGAAVHTGDGAVIEVRNVGAGKSRRKSQRYVLAIDGKDVIVSDYSEAQALIDRAKEEAEAKADEALQRANASQRRPIGKVIRDARKALKAPSIEAPPELADYARKVIADIQATYDQRLRDIEITALMRQRERQQEEDDEEVLMLIA